MKPDVYLKGVLTAIALGLFWIGFSLNTRTVQAQSGTRVIITGIEIPNSSGNLPVGIVATRWENYPGGGGGSWKYEPRSRDRKENTSLRPSSSLRIASTCVAT